MGSPTQMDLGGMTLVVDGIRVGATGPGQSGTELTGAEIALLDGVTAGTVAASKAVTANSSSQVSGLNAISGSITTTKAKFSPVLVQQALSGAGAVNLTTYYTAITNTGSDALTLADSTQVGHVKKVKMIVDPGTDSTLTFNTNATIVFADVGDYAVLVWNGSDWIPVELGNDADGATAPVYTPAS
jgi:hypothetical protein